MPKFTSSDVSLIADQVRFARDKTKRAAHFLIGAGCSITADIPSAKDLIEKIQTDFRGAWAALPEKSQGSYGACMDLMTVPQRREFIRQFLENPKINWGTLALAQLIEQKFVSRVLTVNFDLVLENACGLLGLQPAVYDFGVAPAADTDMIVSPAIIHLHGQSYGLVLLNTDEETDKHRAKLEPILINALRAAPLIVAGYSGSADGIFLTLLKEFRGDYPLYWLGYEEEMPAHIQPLSANRHFRFIGGADFDRFMIELAHSLRCWPPLLFTDPFAHLLKCLTPVVPDYPVGSSAKKIDLLAELKQKIQSRQEAEDQRRSLNALYMLRDYSGVAKSFASQGGQVSREDREIAYWSAVEWGDLLSERAEKAAGSRLASELYAEAAARYGDALKINRSGYEALYNWGTMLSDRADGSSGEEAEKQYAAAREKYEAALVIKRDDLDTIKALGDVLFELAQLSGGEEAARLRDLTAERYDAALKIAPSDGAVWNEWGNLLFEQAKAADSEKDANRLFGEAEKKYQEALKSKYDDEVLSNLGNFVLGMGRERHR
jgi:hypothetical protein